MSNAINYDAKTIIGIKVTKGSKNPDVKYYNYYCRSIFSQWEEENSEEIVGCPCEVVSSNQDLGLVVGDVVEFNYGKAIGNYQPVKSAKILQSVKQTAGK